MRRWFKAAILKGIMAAQTSTVNLLPSDRFEYSKWGRFLLWALSTGRLVVVLTELVVIAAFLSRFWFDRKLSDLRQVRIQRTVSVQAMDEVRTKWERLQFLAEEVNQANGTNFDAAERLSKIQSLTPAGVEFEAIEIGSQSASLTGYVPRSDVFSGLFSRMKAEKSYGGVGVRKLEQSGERLPGFDFEMEIRYQELGIMNQAEE